MQIRRRNHSLSLIRAVYCPQRGRCSGQTLARVPADLKQVPLELWERLTEAERVQLEALCARNRQADALERQRAAALGLPEALKQVAAWYRLRGDGLSLAECAALAEASRHAWSAVLAAMCAAGVGRRRRRSG